MCWKVCTSHRDGRVGTLVPSDVTIRSYVPMMYVLLVAAVFWQSGSLAVFVHLATVALPACPPCKPASQACLPACLCHHMRGTLCLVCRASRLAELPGRPATGLLVLSPRQYTYTSCLPVCLGTGWDFRGFRSMSFTLFLQDLAPRLGLMPPA